MNKKAKSSNAVAITLIVIVAVFALFYFGFIPRIGSTIPTDTVGSGGGSSSPIVTSSTTVKVSAKDALQLGTALSPTSTLYRVNGQDGFITASDATSLSLAQGDKIEAIVTNSSYHSAYISEYTVPASTNGVLSASLKKNATSITLQPYSTTSVALTVASACDTATNQTSLGAGASYNHKLQIQGQDKASTSDLVCVFEASDSTATEDIIVSAMSSGITVTKSTRGTPSIYSTAAGGLIRMFDVSAIEGAVTKELNIYVKSKSGQSIASGDSVKYTCYSKENFVDPLTGLRSYDIEDSTGTRQAIAQYTGIICYN